MIRLGTKCNVLQNSLIKTEKVMINLDPVAMWLLCALSS